MGRTGNIIIAIFAILIFVVVVSSAYSNHMESLRSTTDTSAIDKTSITLLDFCMETTHPEALETCKSEAILKIQSACKNYPSMQVCSDPRRFSFWNDIDSRIASGKEATVATEHELERIASTISTGCVYPPDEEAQLLCKQIAGMLLDQCTARPNLSYCTDQELKRLASR